MNIYDFTLKTIDGKDKSLADYKGKTVLIVNTASKCGFTKQYEGLEKLYKEYKDKGLEILGFPCNQFAAQDPGSDAEIQNFCKLNFGVTFQMFSKIAVRGEEAHPLYKYLTETAPYEGIDDKTEAGNFLLGYIKEHYPEFLKDNSIKWNFTKFLIDKKGNLVKRFESPIEPSDIAKEIEKIF
jgi:glutathione peroxidase